MALTEQKNRQIIEAAIDEFQERGFAGASMDRISDRAQVSKRTVYNHFESKDVLFRCIINQLADKFQHSLQITFNPDVPIREELVRLGWTQGVLLTDPKGMSLARMMMGELIRDPDLAANMNRRLDMVRVVKNFFDTTVEAGALRIPDTWGAAEQFLGLIKTRGFYPKLFGEAVSTHDEMVVIIEDAVEMFLNSYGLPAASAAR